MRSRRVAWSAALLAVATSALVVLPDATGRAALARSQRPNILVFMSDDQTMGTLGVMPAVQALQARGTTYTHYYDSFPLCCPMRATFLTGQYSHNNGVWQNDRGGYSAMHHKNDTVAAWLHDSGYQTGLLGKMLNGYTVDRYGVPKGWDLFRVADDPIYDYSWTRITDEHGVLTDYGHTTYKTDEYAQLAVNLIDEFQPGKPWFLWLTPNGPHAGGPVDPDDSALVPSCSPSSKWRDHDAGAPLPDAALFNEADVSDKPPHISRLPLLTADQQAAIEEAYSQQLECLRSVDDYVATVVQHLADTGQLANTDIIFVSDNGWAYGEHRVPAGKSLPYDYASRLPLVAAGPDFRHEVDPSPRSSVDLAATVADLAHATPGITIDGTSLLSRVSRYRPILHEGKVTSSAGVRYRIHRYLAIRTPLWFYAQYHYVDGTFSHELYNLRFDPGQLRNVFDDPDYEAIEIALADEIDKIQYCSGARCP